MENWLILSEGNKQLSVFNYKTGKEVIVSYKTWGDDIILSDEAEVLPKYVQEAARKEAKKLHR